MPLTSFGRYEVVVSVPADRPRLLVAESPSDATSLPEISDDWVEICTQSFVYFPVLRLLCVAVLIAVVACIFFQPWRMKAVGQSFWVILLGALSVPIAVVPTTSGMAEFLLPLFASQMAGLAIVLWLVCRLRKRRRVAAFFIAEAINCAALFGVMMVSTGASYSLMLLIPSLIGAQLWTLPAALAMVAVRKQFSGPRLLAGLAIMLALVSLPLVVVAMLLWSPVGLQSLILVALPLPYLVVFHLFATRNSWCRAGLIRALGLGAAPATTTPPC